MIKKTEENFFDVIIEEPIETWTNYILYLLAIAGNLGLYYLYYFSFTTINTAIHRTAL